MVPTYPPKLSPEQKKIKSFVDCYVSQLDYKFSMDNLVFLLRNFIIGHGLEIISHTMASSSGKLEIQFHDINGNWYIDINLKAKRVRDKVRAYIPKYVIGKD
jgi:hypothetical protein